MRELPLYAAAAVVYLLIGVLYPTFLLSWVVGAGFLLLFVWVVPAILRRLR